MKSPGHRRGSAMLIVMGMMTFMFMSAVAFALYMRQSRQPSSYLRRTSTAKGLLRVALAESIARIDGVYDTDIRDQFDGTVTPIEGIYDDVYPGVGPAQYVKSGSGKKSSYKKIDPAYNGDYWDNRVFTPFGPTSTVATVSTLAFESLAYLPPAIINDVRVLSQRTRTAMWRRMAYDQGHYAFCAVDVSDCFDVNRLKANQRRTAALGQRVNLSALCWRKEGISATVSYANNMDRYAVYDAEKNTPNFGFVSMADFNAWIGDSSVYAPFMNYVGRNQTDAYKGFDRTIISNELLIAGTWFPPQKSDSNVKQYDLAGGSQPFNEKDLNKNKTDVLNFITPCTKTALGKQLTANIGAIGMACLYDYLDADSHPISFCLPTVETTAMLGGMWLSRGPTPTLTVLKELSGTLEVATGDVDPATGKKKVLNYKRTAYLYGMRNYLGDVHLHLALTFPFLRAEEKGYNCSFISKVMTKTFFAPVDIPSRVDIDSVLYPGENWVGGLNEGIFTAITDSGGVDFDNLTNTGNPVDQIVKAEIVKQSLNIEGTPTANNYGGMPAFWYVETVDEEGALLETGTYAPYYSLEDITSCEGAVIPYNYSSKSESLDVDSNWKAVAKTLKKTVSHREWLSAGKWRHEPAKNDIDAIKALPLVPHVAVWVRVTEDAGTKKEGTTVDMVPARFTDDVYYGDVDRKWERLYNNLGRSVNIGGDLTPIMEFCGDSAHAFAIGDYGSKVVSAGTKADVPLNTDSLQMYSRWNRFVCPDPRFNYAPENWIPLAPTEGGEKEGIDKVWLNYIKTLFGKPFKDGDSSTDPAKCRDADPFMFTSDQGVMQSAGELAYLIAFEPMDGKCKTGSFYGVFNDAMKDRLTGPMFSSRVNCDITTLAANEWMWNTISVFKGDSLYKLKSMGGSGDIEIISGANDFRVNPFSQDRRVAHGVVRYTPYDWFVASTNVEYGLPSADTMKLKEGAKWCFGTDGTAMMANNDVIALADAMCERFDEWAAQATVENLNWESAWDDEAYFDWVSRDDGNIAVGDDQTTLWDMELKYPLYGVDRKFLYSFWRECFQNRQQLFLVFLRAEPMNVSGSGTGSSKFMQLSSKGVALVWRDPLPPLLNRQYRPTRDQVTRPGALSKVAPHRTRVLFYHQFE